MTDVPYPSNEAELRIPAPSDAASKPESTASILLLIVWFVLVTGLVEGLVFFVATHWLHLFVQRSPDSLWTSTLSVALGFSAFLIAFFVAAAVWKRLARFREVVFFLTALSAAELLFFAQRLHWLAVLAICLGIGFQASRVLSRYERLFRAIVRRTVWLLAANFLILALATFGLDSNRERAALAALPPPRPNTPNVLLIVLDTVRAKSLGLYGRAIPTSPNLDRFAERGVVFERALAVAPWTLVSHASMFTGRYAHELSTSWKVPLDNHYPTLAEQMAAAGYATGGFVGNVGYCGPHTGLQRGFARYRSFEPFSLGEKIFDSSMGRLVARAMGLEGFGFVQFTTAGERDANRIFGEFQRWRAETSERPFFAFLNIYDAHSTYVPRARFVEKFGEPMPPPRDFDALPELPPADVIEQGRIGYESEIADIDEQLGQFIEALRKDGTLDDTIVLLTSDHGEQFGEHGIIAHGNSLYTQVIQVPLVIVYPPRVPAGMRVAEPVTLRDLSATLLDLVEAGPSIQAPGQSLARFWNGAPRDVNLDSPILSAVTTAPNSPAWRPVGTMTSLVEGRYHYIRNGDTTEELYDILDDVEETRDLAADPAHADALSRLRQKLDEAVAPK